MYLKDITIYLIDIIRSSYAIQNKLLRLKILHNNDWTKILNYLRKITFSAREIVIFHNLIS